MAGYSCKGPRADSREKERMVAGEVKEPHTSQVRGVNKSQGKNENEN